MDANMVQCCSTYIPILKHASNVFSYLLTSVVLTKPKKFLVDADENTGSRIAEQATTMDESRNFDCTQDHIIRATHIKFEPR